VIIADDGGHREQYMHSAVILEQSAAGCVNREGVVVTNDVTQRA
jgi:hypothetical protein